MKREYNETIKYVETSEPDKVADYIDDLNNQLAEKDEKIEELKDLVDIWKTKLREKMETQILSVTKEKEQQIRHQVCQEIREYCKNNFFPIPNKLGCYVEVNREEFFDNLDQIEKGETK